MAAGRFFIDIEGDYVKANGVCAYCLRKQAVMTYAQMRLHNCVERGCNKCIKFQFVDNPGRNIVNEKYFGDEYRKKVLGCR